MPREQIDQIATDAATMWLACTGLINESAAYGVTFAEFDARQAADAYAATLGVTA